MVCLHCQFSRHLETAQRKAQEWISTPTIASTYSARAQRIQLELDGLKCICYSEPEVSEEAGQEAEEVVTDV